MSKFTFDLTACKGYKELVEEDSDVTSIYKLIIANMPAAISKILNNDLSHGILSNRPTTYTYDLGICTGAVSVTKDGDKYVVSDNGTTSNKVVIFIEYMEHNKELHASETFGKITACLPTFFSLIRRYGETKYSNKEITASVEFDAIEDVIVNMAILNLNLSFLVNCGRARIRSNVVDLKEYKKKKMH